MREFEENVEGAETPVFRGDEPHCMVLAGLACRTCLSGDVEWALDPDPWDATVRCRCRRCDDERTLALTPEQALRLSLHGASAPAAPEPRAGLALIL